ncbi:Symplekin tight junction protein C terminal-domain-containing protein [Obelidium mucronatum]|nr:Symplekin tight junction protein C terminal-domain-containing protein [Obelidium mucronatum]
MSVFASMQSSSTKLLCLHIHLSQTYLSVSPPDPGDVSLDLCQPNHPYLIPSDLQRESVEAFTALLGLLTQDCPSAVMTASVNALFPIIKSRTAYSAPAVETLIQWIVSPPTHLTPLQTKNVQRSIRNEFLAVLSTKIPEVAQFIPKITEILVGMGVKGYEISTRVKARDQGAKRVVVDDGPVPEAAGMPQPLMNQQPVFDVQTIPLNLAVDVVVQVLATTPDALWLERLTQFAQSLLLQEQQHQQLQLHLQQQQQQQRRDPRMLTKTEPDLQGPPLPLTGGATDLFSQLTALNNAAAAGSSNNTMQIKSELAFLGNVAPFGASALAPGTAAAAPALPIAPHEPEFDPTNVNILEMSTEDKLTTWREAVSRILELESFFDAQTQQASAATAVDISGGAFGLSVNPVESVVAARTGWMLLLVRLLTSWSSSNSGGDDSVKLDDEWAAAVRELRDQLFKFVVQDFRTRYELAILWLHEEYHLGLVNRMRLKKSERGGVEADGKAELVPFATYEALFHKILYSLKGEARDDEQQESGVLPGLDPKDRTFTKFLIDVPVITKEALEVVLKGYCEDSERMLLGFSSLRDLIHLRPAVRDFCIEALFSYCIHPDKIIRSNAILLARRWISPDHATLGPIVEKYATDTLLRLCGPPPSADDEEDGGAAWEEIDAIRHFELYFALSSKKHSLLSLLFKSFGEFLPEVATTVIQQIDPLIRSMSSAVTPICGILKSFPTGAESLVRKVVDILTEKEPVHDDVVSTVVDLVVEHDLDGTWLLRVVSGLTRPQILQFLPKLISLLDGTEERERLVEAGLMKVIATDQDGVNPILTAIIANPNKETDKKVNPAEVLIAIHNMEGSVDLKYCLEGTKLCIKHPEVFKQESLAIVIQQLVDQQRIPTLFMRTVLESVKLYPNLATFINGILTRLISKRVWVNPNLWKGFVICCKLTAPTSFSVIITLPKPQLEDILNKEPGMKPRLFEYVMGLPTAMRARVKGLLPMLEDPHQMVQQQQQVVGQFGYAEKGY